MNHPSVSRPGTAGLPAGSLADWCNVHPLAARRLVLGLAIALSAAACGDEGTGPPPPPAVPDPTLQNIWPNDDGRFWIYDLTEREWDGPGPQLYPACDSVPPAPSLVDVARLLESQPAADTIMTAVGIDLLRFDGRITTESGASGQNLVETIFSPRRSDATSASESVFLAHLFLARPDLRAAIRSRDPALASSRAALVAALDGALLLGGGGAWVKTEAYIGTYGDLDTLLAWKYLGSNLAPGTEFTHQLVPSLADDVFLHGRVHRILPWRTAAGTFEKALEVIYLVDYGLSEAIDQNQQFLGCFRSITYGSVVYAPTAGPVYCYERSELAPASVLEPAPNVVFDVKLSLIGTGLPVTSAARRVSRLLPAEPPVDDQLLPIRPGVPAVRLVSEDVISNGSAP